MARNSEAVEQLDNIGPTVARRLNAIGIKTRGDLASMGPAEAYRRISEKYPGKHVPVCYYLYSLEGALRNRHWDDIGETVKQRLVKQVGTNGRRNRN